MNPRSVLITLGLLGLLALAWVYRPVDNNRQTYLLATATSGGTFYPVGVAMATLSRQVLEEPHGFALAAISSAGSEENLRLLRRGEVQFAILQGLYGAWAVSATGRLEGRPPFTELRSVTALWPNVEHVLIRESYRQTGTLDDLARLRGRPFSIGARHSGTEGSNRHILRALGFDPDADFQLVYQGYGASADAFQNQRIDAMNTPAGVPVGAVTRAMAAAGGQAVLLEVSGQQLAAINRHYPGLWQFVDLPPDTYPGQARTLRTIGQMNLLATTADLPEAHVYRLLEALYEHLGYLQAFHSATRAMRLESAVQGLPLPLHPGAVRFYRERGLELPEHLIPLAEDEDA